MARSRIKAINSGQIFKIIESTRHLQKQTGFVGALKIGANIRDRVPNFCDSGLRSTVVVVKDAKGLTKMLRKFVAFLAR